MEPEIKEVKVMQENRTQAEPGSEAKKEREPSDVGLRAETLRVRDHMKLQIESRSENEAFARVAVAVFISRLDPTLEELDDLKTAVSEAVTNAVIHGYGNGEGTICIETEIEDRLVTVTIRDEGAGIENVEQAMEPMYTSDKTGERSGMGFSFMEAFMDQVDVDSKPGVGTTVTMKKTIGR